MSVNLSLLRQPAFRSYFFARTISSLGSSFGLIALTFAVLESDRSPFDLGLILAAGVVPTLFLLLLGGVVGDRLERRLILMSSDLTMALTQGLTALVLALDSETVWVLCVLQAIRGSASSFFNPAATGMVPSVLAREDIQRGNALLGISRNIAGIVGPALGGAVMVVWSPNIALVLDAATFVISAAFILRIPRSKVEGTTGLQFVSGLREGWYEFSSRAWVWRMVVGFGIYQATVLPAIFIVGAVIAEGDGIGASGWALVLSARAAGSLAAGLVLLRWRPRRPLVASVIMAFLDVTFLYVIGAQGPLWAHLVFGMLAAAGVTMSDTLWETTLQREVPTHVLGRVSSYDWLGSVSMLPLGNILMGVALSSIAPSTLVFTVLGCHVLVSSALLGSRSIRSIRYEPAKA